MTLISQISLEDIIELQNRIKDLENKSTCLADAAQQYMSCLYEKMEESIVLARLFATIPYRMLPDINKEFVMALAHSKGVGNQVGDDSLILSLLGSRGANPQWNDRRGSEGHVGIPLISSSFIDEIPMMSRLLKQLGAGISWIDKDDTALVIDTFKSISGVFYVKDAKAEVDKKGRKIITAQDFVKKEKVETVFGFGGGFAQNRLFFSTIIFLRETIERDIAEKFMLQASKFKIATMEHVVSGRIFD